MKPQDQIDTRALERAVEAHTLATTVKADISRLDGHMMAMRTDTKTELATLRLENTSQHERALNKISEGSKLVHGRIDKILWATILGMGSLLMLGLGILWQVSKVPQ